MLRSTFAGFKTASSALKVSQSLLDVVGQNMANVNNEGYTRQRLDISSVSSSSSNLKYGTNSVAIGQGVVSTGLSQCRDAFLDLRYRQQSALTGSEDIQSEALRELENVFDEIETDGLDAQFSDFIDQLQSLTSSPSDAVVESVVKTSASMLCQIFNNYSDQINTIKDEQTSYLRDGAIVDVNQLMKNIAELNEEIKKDNISGTPALELNDQRNALLDELSSYMDIEVNLTATPIGGGNEIDVLSVTLRESGMKLIDNGEYSVLGVAGAGTDYTGISLLKSIDNTLNNPSDPGSGLKYQDGTDITGAMTSGQIGGYIKMLNGQGEFGASGSPDDRGLQYYEKMLDTLAGKFAEVMNDCNRTKKLDADGNPLTDADGNYIYEDKLLFEAEGSGTVLAANIKISEAWKNSTGSYITNTDLSSSLGDNSGDTSNILKMIAMFEKDTDFTAENGYGLFTGTFQEFFSNTATTLSLQVENTQDSFETYEQTLYDIENSRQSMSSVDLDEEGVNLLAYSKSYNAAARLMTTLDELLDTLINRMAV